MGVLKNLSPDACPPDRWWKYVGGVDDAEIARLVEITGAVTFDEAVEAADDWLRKQGISGVVPRPFKEGHTSLVLDVPGHNLVLNVARDQADAKNDLVRSFSRLKEWASTLNGGVAKVHDITEGQTLDGKKLAIAVVEKVTGALELTVDRGRVGTILRFNETAPPDVTWFDESESERIREIVEQRLSKVSGTINVQHGDVVIDQAGSIRFVACDA